jgi:hypothetical protein
MWRIGAAVVAVVVVGTLIVLATGSSRPGQQTPAKGGEGLVSNNDGSLYFVQHPESNVAIYLPGQWTSSTRSSTNAPAKSWMTDVTLQAKGKPDVTLQGDSKTPTQINVNGVKFDLTAGSLLRLNADGKVEQLPFAPLPATDQAYLKRLNEYFAR